jgi:hypothetical protein
MISGMRSGEWVRPGVLKLWYASHCSVVHGHSKKKSEDGKINAVT